MSLIILIICKNCNEILSTDQEIVFNSIQPGILFFRKFSNIDANDEKKYVSSLDNYDNYCVYSELKCVNCQICIGKKYITMNEFLIKNSIKFSINNQTIMKKEYLIEQAENNKTEYCESQNFNLFEQNEKNTAKNLELQKFNNISLFNVVSFSKGICALPSFFDSQYKVQKKSMKKLSKRIHNLENQITLMIDFLSKRKNVDIN